MCDTFVTLTTDGVLFAKNSDRDPNESQHLRWYAAAEHGFGATVRCTYTTIAQAQRTHPILLSQPWWMWGAEIGTNEHGVVIGNEAVFTRRTGKQDPGSLLGMDLLRLALERSSTRDEAVHVIVSLLERHGQGGSCSHEHPRFTYDNSFIVADPDGATVVETAGRHWATEEVRGSRSISNALTIDGFAERYADPVRGRVARAATRRRHTTACASAARTPADLIGGLRGHGRSGGPAYSPVSGALGAPCAHAGGLVTSTQSTASWVADLRGGASGSGLHWVTGTSAPCTSIFKPVTVGEPLELEPKLPTSATYDPSYLWWRHEVLHRRAVRDHASWTPFAARRDAVEREWLESPPASREAFAEADRLEVEWLSRLGVPDDKRPGWVRGLWRRWDAAAGMQEGATWQTT